LLGAVWDDYQRTRNILGIEAREFYGRVCDDIGWDSPAQGHAGAAAVHLDRCAANLLGHGGAQAFDIEVGGDEIVLRLAEVVEQRERADAGASSR